LIWPISPQDFCAGDPVAHCSRGLEIVQSYKPRSVANVALTDLMWRLVALLALGGCAMLGWYLFELTRRHHIDNSVASFFRAITASLQSLFRLDPVLALIVLPFAVFVVLILIGLLIWMRKDS